MLQCVAVRCNVNQCESFTFILHLVGVAAWFCALQCVAVHCTVLQRVDKCCSIRWVPCMEDKVLQCVAVCLAMLQCVAVCCSMLQYVAVY